jgi:hypothetical protein
MNFSDGYKHEKVNALKRFVDAEIEKHKREK